MSLTTHFNAFLLVSLTGEYYLKKRLPHASSEVDAFFYSIVLFAFRFLSTGFTVCILVDQDAFLFANSFLILCGYIAFPSRKVRERAAEIFPRIMACTIFIPMLQPAARRFQLNLVSEDDSLLLISFFWVVCRRPPYWVFRLCERLESPKLGVPLFSYVMMLVCITIGIIPISLAISYLSFAIRFFALINEWDDGSIGVFSGREFYPGPQIVEIKKVDALFTR